MPQIVAKRDTRNIFPVGLPRGPHAARWYAHFSWTDTTKHVLRVFRDALDSMTEDQVRFCTNFLLTFVYIVIVSTFFIVYLGTIFF